MIEEMELKDVRVIGLENAQKKLDKYRNIVFEEVANYIANGAFAIVICVFLFCVFFGLNIKFGILLSVILIGCCVLIVKHAATYNLNKITRAKREIKRLYLNNNIGDVRYTIVSNEDTTEYTIFVNGVESEFLNKVKHNVGNEIPILDYNEMALIVNFEKKG